MPANYDWPASPRRRARRYSSPLVAVVLVPLPVELSLRLGPPPIGYRYAYINGDVVRIAELAAGTLLVVDALNGLLN